MCQLVSFLSLLLEMIQLLSILQNYTEYVGTKSTFRLLNRGSAKALNKVVELDGMSAICLFIPCH
jgi:hypothetical protein